MFIFITVVSRVNRDELEFEVCVLVDRFGSRSKRRNTNGIGVKGSPRCIRQDQNPVGDHNLPDNLVPVATAPIRRSRQSKNHRIGSKVLFRALDQAVRQDRRHKAYTYYKCAAVWRRRTVDPLPRQAERFCEFEP